MTATAAIGRFHASAADPDAVRPAVIERDGVVISRVCCQR